MSSRGFRDREEEVAQIIMSWIVTGLLSFPVITFKLLPSSFTTKILALSE